MEPKNVTFTPNAHQDDRTLDRLKPGSVSGQLRFSHAVISDAVKLKENSYVVKERIPPAWKIIAPMSGIKLQEICLWPVTE